MDEFRIEYYDRDDDTHLIDAHKLLTSVKWRDFIEVLNIESA